MDRALLFSAVVFASYATAAAQYPAQAQRSRSKCSTWDSKSMVGPKDSVVATSVLAATADGKGWTLKLPNRDPIPVRVVATEAAQPRSDPSAGCCHGRRQHGHGGGAIP